MDELLKQLSQFEDLTSTFTMLDVAVVFGLSLVLCLMVGWVYRFTHKGISYSQSYVHTLVILGTVIAFIMLVIGSNIARAFTLVGALSIIRFRNAVKETKDIGFVFLVMAIGMACGTRFYRLAIFATFALSGAVIVMDKLNLFAKVIRERILIVRMPEGTNYEETVAELFDKRLTSYNLISVETVRKGTLQELIYSVVLRRKVDPARLLEEIRAVNGDNKVSLVLGQQEIDL
jgi:uncharacterized membrane protein YhiD involved in acid resistance